MSTKEINSPVVDSLLTDWLRLKEGIDTEQQTTIYNPFLYTLRINYVLNVDTTLSSIPSMAVKISKCSGSVKDCDKEQDLGDYYLVQRPQDPVWLTSTHLNFLLP